MSKARDVADLFSDGGDLADGQIDVTELSNSGTGDLAAGNLNVSGNITAAGKLQVSPSSGTSVEITSGTGIAFTNSSTSTIYGQSTLTLDPSPWVDAGGTVNVNGALVVEGDLTVNGTTTTINSTTKDIADLAITVASGAATSSDATGAGISIDGANVDFHWNYGKAGMKLTKNSGGRGVNLILSDPTTIADTLPEMGYLQTSRIWNGDDTLLINNVHVNGAIEHRTWHLNSHGAASGDAFFYVHDQVDDTEYTFLTIRGTGSEGTAYNYNSGNFPVVEIKYPNDKSDNNWDGNGTNGTGTPAIILSSDRSATFQPKMELLGPTIRSNYRYGINTNTYQNTGPILHGAPIERVKIGSFATDLVCDFDNYQIFDFTGSNASANFTISLVNDNFDTNSEGYIGSRVERAYVNDGWNDTSQFGSPWAAVTIVVMVKNATTAYNLSTLRFGTTSAKTITSNILWQGGSQPSGNANSVDMYTISLLPQNPTTYNNVISPKAFVSVAQFA